jgi:hypothetical protein
MPRSLSFQLADDEVAVAIEKVDRAKLYGSVDRRAFDRDSNKCYLGALSHDGLHLFGRDSFEQGYVDGSGEWVDKGDIGVVDASGAAVVQVEASFKAAIALAEIVSIDEYLLHLAKSVYQLTGEGVAALLTAVNAADGIYAFPFNYSRSYEPDRAFLIPAGDELFMVVTTRGSFAFAGPDEVAEIEEEIEDGGDDMADAMDFSMM